MKVNIKVNELVDGEIDFVSLVKHGANRSPWKIIKMAETPSRGLWDGLLPELDRLEKRLAEPGPVTKELKTVKMKKTDESAAQAAEIRKHDIAKLRLQLAGLYDQQQNLWERPNTPAFQKFDDELTFSIEKTESELRLLVDDRPQIDAGSAYFRRGGSSAYSAATVSDSAYDQRDAALCKAESQIDLRPTITTTDEHEVAKIDLTSLAL